MDKTIQLQKDADVLNEKGEEIGLLERVVLDPETKVVTDLIVRTGSLLGRKEKVVSIDMVLETRDHLIVLRDDKDRLEHLPPFEEKRLVFDFDDPEHPKSPTQFPPLMYGYPTSGPVDPPKHDEKFITWTVRNIPAGTVAMKEGARVIAMGGKQVGIVESVLADSQADRITHLCISSRHGSKETKLIPIQWVKTLGEDEVRLRVKKDSIEAADELVAIE